MIFCIKTEILFTENEKSSKIDPKSTERIQNSYKTLRFESFVAISEPTGPNTEKIASFPS